MTLLQGKVTLNTSLNSLNVCYLSQQIISDWFNEIGIIKATFP